jgi:hypothetical protein
MISTYKGGMPRICINHYTSLEFSLLIRPILPYHSYMVHCRRIKPKDGDGVGRPIGSPTRPIKMTLMGSNSDHELTLGQRIRNHETKGSDGSTRSPSTTQATPPSLSHIALAIEFDGHGWMQVCVLLVSS